MITKNEKQKNSTQPEQKEAVGLMGLLGASLRICKNCIHSINISTDPTNEVYWCNRKHKIDLVTGEPFLIPCYHERENSLFKCGEKGKYFISNQKQQEANNKNV